MYGHERACINQLRKQQQAAEVLVPLVLYSSQQMSYCELLHSTCRLSSILYGSCSRACCSQKLLKKCPGSEHGLLGV